MKSQVYIPILLTLVLSICCSACSQSTVDAETVTSISTTSGDSVPTASDQELYDSNQDENHFAALFTSSEEAVYFFSGMDLGDPNLLVFVDKKSGISGPLCGKAECLHSGNDCNAFFGKVYSLSRYGDSQLILVCEHDDADKLNSLEVVLTNTDGSGRRHLRDILDPWEGANQLNTWVLFHRNYIFVGGIRQTITDSTIKNISFINAYPIGSDEIISIYEGNANPLSDGRVSLQAVDNSLYYLDSEYVISGDSDEKELRLIVGKWDLQTKSSVEIFDGPFPIYIWDSHLNGSDMLLSGLGSSEIYRLNILDGKYDKVFEFPDNYSSPVISFIKDGSVEYSYPYKPDYSSSRIIISDYYGRVKARHEQTEGLLTFKGTAYTRTFCGCDNDNLYYYFDGKTDEKHKKRVFCSVSLSTGEQKTLWEQEVPSL